MGENNRVVGNKQHDRRDHSSQLSRTHCAAWISLYSRAHENYSAIVSERAFVAILAVVALRRWPFRSARLRQDDQGVLARIMELSAIKQVELS